MKPFVNSRRTTGRVFLIISLSIFAITSAVFLSKRVRAEAVQDAWPGAAPIPYLRSVPDPYDSYSPHHNWGPYNFTSSRLAASLGLGSPVESVRVQENGDERVSVLGSEISEHFLVPSH